MSIAHSAGHRRRVDEHTLNYIRNIRVRMLTSSYKCSDVAFFCFFFFATVYDYDAMPPFIMAALRRTGHYIFVLSFLLSSSIFFFLA